MSTPFDLARTLDPVTPASFLAEFWEQAPLSVAREDSAYYESLLSAADAESLVAGADPAKTSVELLGEERESGGTASEGPRRGATIRLKGVQSRWPPLQSLCRELERELGVAAIANLYRTPPRSQALPAHWDGHDVLVLQIAGSKRWRVYDSPVALPTDLLPVFGFERARPRPPPGAYRHWISQPSLDAFGPEAPAREIDLRAGDLLYLPRGHGHEAHTGERASIHVTLGLYSVTWADLLCVAVYQVAQRDVRFRRALPMGFAGEPEVVAAALGEFAVLTGAFHRAAGDPAAASGAFAEMAQRFILGALRVDDDPANECASDRAADIGPETPLRRRLGTLATLRVEPDSVLLFFSGSWLRGPRVAEEPIRYMLAADEFTTASLPGPLDEEGRLTLARRLVRAGFLTFALS